MENLDEILKNEPEPEAATTPAAEAPIVDAPSGKADPPSERLRDEKGRFAPKETGVQEQPAVEAAPATSEVPPTPPSQLPQEEYSALKDERRKRQELERRLQMMEQQLRQPVQPQQPAVDFWDDPQRFMSSFGESLLQQWEQKQTVQRIDASEKAAKAKYADYDDAYEAFEQAVQINPRLAYELAQQPDPGEFAYRKGKDALALQQFGSVEAMIAAERQKWEAEIKAAAPIPKPSLPSTTAADGSVGARTGPDWSGPAPLADYLR